MGLDWKEAARKDQLPDPHLLREALGMVLRPGALKACGEMTFKGQHVWGQKKAADSGAGSRGNLCVEEGPRALVGLSCTG